MATSILRSSIPRIARTSLPRYTLANVRYASTLPAAQDNSAYVPGGPVLKGTVNDPTEFPPPSRTHGSHHWAFERILSASLVPLTAAAFATSGSAYPVLDGVLGVSLVMHSHIGFDSILVDYVHKRKFTKLGPLATWALRTATVGTLLGVYQFNTNDIGLTELISKVWAA